MEHSKIAERERLFLVYAKQWWREFLQIRPQHSDRLVKIFAQDETGTNRLTCSFVTPLRAGRLIDSAREAARFVSLIAYERAENVGGGRTEMWCNMHSLLCKNKGVRDLRRHGINHLDLANDHLFEFISTFIGIRAIYLCTDEISLNFRCSILSSRTISLFSHVYNFIPATYCPTELSDGRLIGMNYLTGELLDERSSRLLIVYNVINTQTMCSVFFGLLSNRSSQCIQYILQDCEDHVLLLCNLLLGFGLAAYVSIGTKGKGVAHSWVTTISPKGEVVFWESLTAQRSDDVLDWLL